MSFTVDLILTPAPIEQAEAWEYIEQLREEYYEDKAGSHKKLVLLHDTLTLKYPCLCSYADDDIQMEKCPWADGPMMDNFASKMGMLAIRYSRSLRGRTSATANAPCRCVFIDHFRCV